MSPKKSLKQEIKSLDNFDWREIDGAIMDFQIHVREVTGGNNYSCVDSTELKRALVSSIKSYVSASIDKILETAKGCRPEDNMTEFEHKENCDYQRPGCDCGREQNLAYQSGLNQSNAEFDKNWKEKIGE